MTVSVSTSSLPAGQVDVAYTTTLAATGGTTPYTWAVLTGTLPAGLTLNTSTGVVSGTATQAQSAAVTFKVTDAVPDTADSSSLTLVIGAEVKNSEVHGPGTVHQATSPTTAPFTAPYSARATAPVTFPPNAADG